MMFKSLAAFALATAALTAPASAWIDEVNAQLNTPAARAAVVKAACGSTAPVDQVNCTYYKKHGAPISDVRYAIAATSIVVGGALGGALHVHPGLIGQKHLHILGWHPTFGQAVLTGAATGYVVTKVATHRYHR